MSQALPELAADFQATHGVRVVRTLGASGALAQQIANGAPYDVFLSADKRFVEQLAASHHIDAATARVYAVGHLALYSPSLHLAAIADLRQPSVKRIAIANPDVAPYGRAAKQALERSALWADVKDKLVIAQTIRQTVDMVESGNVDVALTSLSLVNAITVPESLYDPIQQEAGIVIRRNANPRAKDFLDYLSSPGAQNIFRKYRFTIP